MHLRREVRRMFGAGGSGRADDESRVDPTAQE
jgi:hypothetical protein